MTKCTPPINKKWAHYQWHYWPFEVRLGRPGRIRIFFTFVAIALNLKRTTFQNFAWRTFCSFIRYHIIFFSCPNINGLKTNIASKFKIVFTMQIHIHFHQLGTHFQSSNQFVQTLQLHQVTALVHNVRVFCSAFCRFFGRSALYHCVVQSFSFSQLYLHHKWVLVEVRICTLKVHRGRYSRACPTTPTCICLTTCWRIRALVPWTWSPVGNVT